MNLGVRADGQDGEQVPCYSDQVHGEEENEEWLLVLRLGGEFQEDELKTLLVWLSLSMIMEPTKTEKIPTM